MRQSTQPMYGTAAGNVNDKITQMSDGRVFYVQNYEGGGWVFCEVYYSDDNGITWTKSQTCSRDIEGNEGITKFGECKVMETADGTLRLYCSWSSYGCIVYSESEDNGVTWGPLQKMEEFVCSRSSMQFVKDTYADNDTTYYMVWVYNEPGDVDVVGDAGIRSRLALAKTTDGVNWEYLGDVWRWETNHIYHGSSFAQIVDPCIQVTEDYIIVGSGISEKINESAHQEQRQHLWSIKKDTLTPYISFPKAN